MLGKPIINIPFDHRSITQSGAYQPELFLIHAFEQRLKEFACMTFEEYDERRSLCHAFANLTRQRQ